MSHSVHGVVMVSGPTVVVGVRVLGMPFIRAEGVFLGVSLVLFVLSALRRSFEGLLPSFLGMLTYWFCLLFLSTCV